MLDTAGREARRRVSSVFTCNAKIFFFSLFFCDTTFRDISTRPLTKAGRGLLTIRNNDDGSNVAFIVQRVWIETSGMTNRTEAVIAGPFCVPLLLLFFSPLFLVDTSIPINFKRIDCATDACTRRKTLMTPPFVRPVSLKAAFCDFRRFCEINNCVS